MKHILFVCGKNKLRSPTAESIFCEVDGWSVRSAGIRKDAATPIGAEDILWADYIFVMEPRHRKKLQEKYKKQINHQHIICLNIPDQFEYMDKELIERLKRSVPTDL